MLNRRNFLAKVGLGVGAAAVGGLVGGTKLAQATPCNTLPQFATLLTPYGKLLCLFEKQIKMCDKRGLKDPWLYYAIRQPNGAFNLYTVRLSELPTCNLVEDMEKRHPFSGDLWQSPIFPLLKETATLPRHDPVDWNTVPSRIWLANSR